MKLIISLITSIFISNIVHNLYGIEDYRELRLSDWPPELILKLITFISRDPQRLRLFSSLNIKNHNLVKDYLNSPDSSILDNCSYYSYKIIINGSLNRPKKIALEFLGNIIGDKAIGYDRLRSNLLCDFNNNEIYNVITGANVPAPYLSSDGSLIVKIGNDLKNVFIIDANNNEILDEFRVKKNIAGIITSPNNEYLLVKQANNKFKLCNRKGEKIRTILGDVAIFSLDSKLILLRESLSIYLYNIETGRELNRRLVIDEGAASWSCHFSNNKFIKVDALIRRNGIMRELESRNIYLWNILEAQDEHNMKAYEEVFVSLDNKVIAYEDRNENVFIKNIEAGQVEVIEKCNLVTMNEDGSIVIVLEKEHLKAIFLENNKELILDFRVKNKNMLFPIYLDSNLLFIKKCGFFDYIWIFNIRTGKLLHKICIYEKRQLSCKISSDKKSIYLIYPDKVKIHTINQDLINRSLSDRSSSSYNVLDVKVIDI